MAQARILVYSTPFCGYCAAAKRLLIAKGAVYTEIDVMLNSERRQEMLAKSGGQRTVPQIFIDGRHIGGFDELNALDKAGELNALLGAPAHSP